MPTNYFDLLGNYLLKKTPNKTGSHEDELVICQWLDDAPALATQESLATWGQLMAWLVHRHEGVSFLANYDVHAQRLVAYFDAMAQQGEDVWWHESDGIDTYINQNGEEVQTRAKPIYTAFEDVCYQLSTLGMGKTHPFLLALVKNGWNPDDMLEVLDNMHMAQVAHYEDTNKGFAFEECAQGFFLRALRPLMLDTTWRPVHPLYTDMWSVHDYHERNKNLDLSQRVAKFAKLLCKHTAKEVDKTIVFLCSDRMLGPGMHDFFPLRLHECNAKDTLRALVCLISGKDKKGDPNTKAMFAKHLLAKHHPDVFQMLDMHLSLFADARPEETYADVLVEGFERMLGRTTPAMAVAPLPPDMLDEPTVA